MLRKCRFCKIPGIGKPDAPPKEPVHQHLSEDECCGNEDGLWKLPRMHHCSVCEKCCVKFDHHCGMAINCIGINNYNLFVLFLAITILVSLFHLKIHF
jgi:hypothetical protein